MTYSEFGRRVRTTTAAARTTAPRRRCSCWARSVKGGFYGEPPSLTDLDNDGDLKHSTDFRQVYATVLANWIDTDPVPVLGHVAWPTLPLL